MFLRNYVNSSGLNDEVQKKKKRKKKPAQGIAFNIFIVKANMIKMPLIPLIHCDHTWGLHNLLKAENVKLEHVSETAPRNEKRFVVDLILTVY